MLDSDLIFLLAFGVFANNFWMAAANYCNNFTEASTCRDSACEWHCTMGTCDDIGVNRQEECSTNPVCAHFCFQPCECRKAGCEYHAISGQCRPGGAVCTPFSLNHNALKEHDHGISECHRPGVFYSSAGAICYNRVRRGSCQFSEVLNAINFVGAETYDHRGVFYYSEFCGDTSHCGYRDDYGTIIEGTAPQLILTRPSDVDLYSEYIQGSPEITIDPGINKCIKLPVFIRKPGAHEICMKLGDLSATEIGERNFDIYLTDEEEDHETIRHSYVIAKAFDPMVYQIDPRRGIELCINVMVIDHVRSGKQLYVVQGYTSWEEFYPESLALNLCYGDCEHSKNHGYVLGAYHVLKFDD